MLEVAGRLVMHRGVRGLRIDAIVTAAGVSRGSFYTYFDDIGDFVNVVGVRAIREASAVVDQVPEGLAPGAVCRWLRRYADVNRTSGPLTRAWLEATTGPLRHDRATVIDDSRRPLAPAIRARAVGDAEVDAVTLLAVTEVFASQPRTKAEFDVFVRMIERGFLVTQP
jgi:AcrR family transcriptional regulator